MTTDWLTIPLPTVEEVVDEYIHGGELSLDEIRDFPPRFREQAVNALIKVHADCITILRELLTDTKRHLH